MFVPFVVDYDVWRPVLEVAVVDCAFHREPIVWKTFYFAWPVRCMLRNPKTFARYYVVVSLTMKMDTVAVAHFHIWVLLNHSWHCVAGQLVVLTVAAVAVEKTKNDSRTVVMWENSVHNCFGC